MQIQNRNNYKFLKLTDHSRVVLSIIPNSWEILNLGSISKPITKGTTPTTEGDDYVKEGIPFVKVQSIQEDGNIDLNKCAYITKTTHQKLLRSQLKENDILFTIAGTLGRVGRVKKQHVPSNTNQAISIIRIKDTGYDGDFLDYFLRSKAIQKQIGIEKTIMAQPNLSLTQVSNLKIIKPPLKEQQKIASILSNVDSLIHQTQKEIEQTQRLKKGLMQRLLTKGINHKDYKKVTLGTRSRVIEIPEEWKLKPLKSFVKHITKGATPTTYGYEWSQDQNDVLFIRNECIKENKFSLEGSLRITRSAHDFMKRSIVQGGDILISITGEIGKTCIFPFSYKAANINQHIARIRLASPEMDPMYIMNILNSYDYSAYFQTINQGLTHPHLSLGQVQGTLVPVPPISEQRNIVSILSSIDSYQQFQDKRKIVLETLKKGLMQKLLTGQIRVKI